MNNFEHWKEGLTVEQLVNEEQDMGLTCYVCPAEDFCFDMERDVTSCQHSFQEWGNQPYEAGE